jgi:hypothetical protein
MVSLSSHNTKVIKNTENIGSKLYFTNLEKNNYIIEIFNKYDIDNKYSINYNNNIVDKLNIEVPEFIDRNNIIQSQGLPSFKKKYLKLT